MKAKNLIFLLVSIIIFIYVVLTIPLPGLCEDGDNLLQGDIVTLRSKFVTINKSTCSVSLTITECCDTLITNYGWNGTADQTFTFPAAGPGLKTKFLNLITDASEDIYFDTPGATTQFVLDGTACGDGERVWTDNPTKYESITCHTFTEDGTNYDWACDSINGAWLDKGS